MLASPMVIGFDLRGGHAGAGATEAGEGTAATIAALTHPGILAISQDPLGQQATLAPPPTPPTPPTPPPPPPSRKRCLGSLGVYGTDPKKLTHLVPCGAAGMPPAASRWLYDATTKQLKSVISACFPLVSPGSP